MLRVDHKSKAGRVFGANRKRNSANRPRLINYNMGRHCAFAIQKLYAQKWELNTFGYDWIAFGGRIFNVHNGHDDHRLLKWIYMWFM